MTRGLSSFLLFTEVIVYHSDWAIVTAWDMRTSVSVVLEALEERESEGNMSCIIFFSLKEIRLVLVGQKQFTKPGLRESAKNSLSWVLPLKLKSVPLKKVAGPLDTHCWVVPVPAFQAGSN